MSDFISREASVLGPGLVNGLENAASESWQGIKKGAHDLAANPLKATGHYLAEHGVDFAAGAAIAALVPNGLASKLLLAYSARGVVSSTFTAMKDAAAPSANLDSVREEFSRSIGHEGSLMASSLPMTIAGGMVGRGAANVLLGKGNVIPDLIRGDVTRGDVANNARNFAADVTGSKVHTVVTDLDDTTFPLKSYLVHSLKDNVGMIADKMNLPESEVIRLLGPQKMNPWFLETSPLARQFAGTPLEFQNEIVKPFWETDAAAMHEHLKPYNSVISTLDQIHANGGEVVALTNAPMPLAINRLYQSGLSNRIDRLYAIDTPEPALSEVVSPESLEFGRKITAESQALPHGIGSIVALSENAQKPDLSGLRTVLSDTKQPSSKVVAIGDNLDGDGAAPEHFGVPFIFAQYGKTIAPGYREFLSQFRPSKGDAVDFTPSVHPQSVAVADSYAELLNHLRRPANINQAWSTLSAAWTSPRQLRSALGFNLLPDQHEQ